MNLQDYIEKMKKVQENFINFIDNEYQEEENYENLIQCIINQNINTNEHEMKIFLYIINQISNNHYRYPYLLHKIEKNLKFYENEIRQYYSNWELFKIFKENKRILLFFIEEKMINIDEIIFREMMTKKCIDWFYPEYFSPELKPFYEEFKLKNENKKNSKKFKDSELGYEDYSKIKKIKNIFSESDDDLDNSDDSNDSDDDSNDSDDFVENCFTECILCHHNDVANYIEQNFYTGKLVCIY